MVLIPGTSVCIDRYEASEHPAKTAASRSMELPWINIGFDDAAAACEEPGSGKRICKASEWLAACEGLETKAYPYGNDCEETYCNGLYHHNGTRIETGSMPDCVGSVPGLFDMSGNLKEWVEGGDSRGCTVGGSYQSECSSLRCDSQDCLTPEDTQSDRIGFRCCLTL